MNKRSLALATLSIATLSGVAAAPAAFAADDATVYVLHGVPGATVDVYVNEKKTLTNFKPGDLTDALKLPAGEYDLKVTAAGKTDALFKADDVAVPAGANVTVVAHLDVDGKPKLSPFVNDVSKVDAGEGRLTVRHAAAAPAVDVRANEKVAFSNVVNGKEVKADLPAGDITADVVLAGTDTVAIGPADVTVAEGKNTIVYAWGSASDANLKLAVQVLDGMHSSPHGVPSGDAEPAGNALGTIGLLAAGLAAGTAVIAGGRRKESVKA